MSQPSSDPTPCDAGASDAATGEKSKNQLKNDKKREEKMAKFLAKQDKISTVNVAKVGSKPKSLNIKTVEVAEDCTIPGERKGKYPHRQYISVYLSLCRYVAGHGRFVPPQGC